MVVRRLLFVLPLAIFLVAGAFMFWGLNPERDPNAIPSVLIDQPVPDFALEPIPGSPWPGLASADLKTGEVTLVNFFASWCLPCRAEHALLVRLAKEDGLRLVGVNYKNEPAEALAWLDELGNPYQRIGADLNGRAGIEWGVTGVPETFIIDGAGTIRYRHVGPINPPELDGKIRPVLEALQ
jgi:cytochrome c biogenesis protein CcmG/thiol:disulfide interchange protein DsbE